MMVDQQFFIIYIELVSYVQFLVKWGVNLRLFGIHY